MADRKQPISLGKDVSTVLKRTSRESALGHKQISQEVYPMPALCSKADIATRPGGVCFIPDSGESMSTCPRRGKERILMEDW